MALPLWQLAVCAAPASHHQSNGVVPDASLAPDSVTSICAHALRKAANGAGCGARWTSACMAGGEKEMKEKAARPPVQPTGRRHYSAKVSLLFDQFELRWLPSGLFQGGFVRQDGYHALLLAGCAAT